MAKKAPSKKVVQKSGSSKKEVYKRYDETGLLKTNLKYCKKCSTKVLLANHKDRYTCGTCFYTEFKKRVT